MSIHLHKLEYITATTCKSLYWLRHSVQGMRTMTWQANCQSTQTLTEMWRRTNASISTSCLARPLKGMPWFWPTRLPTARNTINLQKADEDRETADVSALKLDEVATRNNRVEVSSDSIQNLSHTASPSGGLGKAGIWPDASACPRSAGCADVCRLCGGGG